MTYSPDDWATAIRVTKTLQGRCSSRQDDALILVQRITGNVLVAGGPEESFSQERPRLIPQSPDEEGLLPIDILYGQYDAQRRAIEIFVKNIEADAKRFGAQPSELLEIVRMHEYAHAVVHLGVPADEVEDHLSKFGAEIKTDWPVFLSSRLTRYRGISTELHEFLAQAITYSTLGGVLSTAKSERLRAVFDALETKQPAHYKLPPTVKESVCSADWPLILDAVRGAIDVYRPEDFSLSAGIERLICSK